MGALSPRGRVWAAAIVLLAAFWLALICKIAGVI